MALPLFWVPGGETEPVNAEFSTRWKQAGNRIYGFYSVPVKESGAFLQTNVMFLSGLAPQSVSVLLPVPQAQVPLLKRDAVDHDEIVQAVLSHGCSSWDPPRLRD